MNCTSQVCIAVALPNPESNTLEKPEDHVFALPAPKRFSPERLFSLTVHVLHT